MIKTNIIIVTTSCKIDLSKEKKNHDKINNVDRLANKIKNCPILLTPILSDNLRRL